VVKVVTVLVTPEEAERLTLASHEGGLRLAMRNYNDSKIVLTPGVDVAGVMKAYSNRPLPAPQLQAAAGRVTKPAVVRPPRPVEVEVMRNGQSREAIEFINDAARTRPAAAPPAAAPAAAPAAPPPSAAAAPASDAPTTMGTATDHGKSAAAAFMPVVEADPALGPRSKTIEVR